MNRKNVLGIALTVMALALIMSCGQKSDPERDFEVEPVDGNSVVITEYLGDKRTVRIPARIRKLPVTEIGFEAFASKKLTSVTIPNSVTIIGWGAFSYNQLTEVTIPDSVSKIMEMAFYGNQLTEVTIPNSVTMIGNRAFVNNQLTSITIGANVSIIGGDNDGFSDAYYDHRHTGGTFIRPNTSSEKWTRKD